MLATGWPVATTTGGASSPASTWQPNSPRLAPQCSDRRLGMKGQISGGRAAHAVPVLPVMHGFVDLQMPTSVKLDDHVRQAFCNNGFQRYRHVTDTSPWSGYSNCAQ